MDKIDCTVIGDALVDITLPLPGPEEIRRLGRGGVVNTSASMSSGGTANVAYYISALGGRTAFIGRVGDDVLGSYFIQDIRQNGIRNGVVAAPGGTTGTAHVLVLPDGERSFIVSRGANAALCYEDLNRNLILPARYLYLTGFTFQHDAALVGIERLTGELGTGTTIVFNPGAPVLAEQYRERFLGFIADHAGILIANRDEAAYLAGADDEDEMLERLSRDATMVVITKGAAGSVIAAGGERCDIGIVPLIPVDTNGAGDAYAAGFIYALCHGHGPGKAGEMAATVATRAVLKTGARVDVSGLAF